jgi:hypothetical protein
MRRVKTQNEPWLPGPGAASSVSSAATSPPPQIGGRHSNDSGTQSDWGRQLERQRMQMMMNHGPWLPGPGAAQAGAMAMPMPGIMGGGEAEKGKPQLPLMMKLITAFFPPQLLKEIQDKGAKPLAEAIWKIHEIFVGSVKLSPFSLLTAGAFHIWFYAANFKKVEGLPKLGIGDIFRMLLYDAVVFFICMVILFVIVILVLIVYIVVSTLTGSTEFAGMIADMM